METYKNIGGESNVESYEIGNDLIKVKFKGNPIIYIYTNIKTGQHHVTKMTNLAITGHGLQTYVNQHRSMSFDKER